MFTASRIICRSSVRVVQRFGHGHHGPSTPPFARIRPATKSLNEEMELVWDDSVAPETAIDFDAPHVSSSRVLLSFLGGIGFFVTCFALVALSDPEGRNPVATRSAVISKARILHNVGEGPPPEEVEDHDE